MSPNVTIRYNFSQTIKEISFADDSGDNFFINFTRNRSIYYSRKEFLGWKSEFLNSNILAYWPSINMGVAYFNNLVRIVQWNNGFRTRLKFEFGFVGTSIALITSREKRREFES
jgi:hypothetical protein